MMKRLTLHLLPLIILVIGITPLDVHAQETYNERGIDIGLVVSDLDESVAFYEEALGLERAYSFDVDSSFARRSGLTQGKPLHAVAMKLRDEENAPVLKLVQVGTPDTHQPSFIDEQSGVRYLTVSVTALEPLLERLANHEISVLGDGVVELSDEESFALVQDPDGVFIELIGPMQAAPEPR